MAESQWIALKRDSIAPSSPAIGATWVVETPSNYDIPSHVRSSYCETTGVVVIEFRYIEPEKLVPVNLGKYGHAMVGKASRRIWRIDFNIHQFHKDRQSMETAVGESIESLPTSEAPNRAITLKALHEESEALFAVAL